MQIQHHIASIVKFITFTTFRLFETPKYMQKITPVQFFKQNHSFIWSLTMDYMNDYYIGWFACFCFFYTVKHYQYICEIWYYILAYPE